MDHERWKHIDRLVQAALGQPVTEREAFLGRTCNGDEHLERELRTLLAAHDRAGSAVTAAAIDPPAGQLTTSRREDDIQTMPDPSMWLPGALFGRYRVEGQLGEGGMGVVFRAMDTRLGRPVAIKTTREQFNDRFEREARAIASLNHPHICTLYDVGPNYLVMELVDGETIAARLKSGPLPADEALLYATQIAAALAEAHAKGIVHRDLKPGNLMIAKSGIKVLDFGLAKSDHEETITASRMVLGTPAYMAPEQREGKTADARSDIYSYGCVLYEMLTGVRVSFQRRRISMRKLEAIVHRCLEEDPARRWQSADELVSRLAAISTAEHRGKHDAAAVTIVLADFANATGDTFFDGAPRQILAGQLENSPHVALLPEPRVRHTLSLMALPTRTTLTAEIAAEVCERTASAAVVEGSIASLGSEYMLSVRATDCRTGAVLHKEQAPAASKDDVFKALTRLAKRFASKAGESLSRVNEAPSLPVEATTSSLEAWRSYSAAMRANQKRAQSPEGASLLKRAIEIDPAFAMAHASLGRQQSDLGESELGAQSIATAYELRDRVSDRENYYITFGYHRQVTRNLELARQTLESWAHKYPGDLYPHGFLSGFTSPGSGHYDRAVDEGLKAIELDPDFAIGYQNVAWAYVYLNRLTEAEALLGKASQRNIEIRQFSLVRYAIAFLRSDRAAMERESAHRQATSQAQGWFEHQEALTCAYQGHVKEANRLSERAVLSAHHGGLLERAALFQGARAVWNALFGFPAEAQTHAAAALSLSRSRDAAYGPGLALALIQESGRAREIAADLARRYPEDTSVQFNYLPTLRALDALSEGDPLKALEMTRVAAPYDLAVPATAYFTGPFFGAMYPVYVRGLAYSRLGRPAEAAAEFQTMLDHPGLVLNDPIGPTTRLQLARALAASEDRSRSAAVYADLLVLWQNADADIPLLRQARAEYMAASS